MKICKQILSTVLVLAMVLSLFGAMTVSAEVTAPVISFTEEIVDETADVRKIVVSATVPAGTYTGTEVVFSYDSKAVQPVNKSGYANVDLSNIAATDNATAQAATNIETGWMALGSAIRYDGDRVGVYISAFSLTGSVIADGGKILLGEFYFKPIEGATFTKDTFKIETEYVKDETILGKIFVDESGARAIALSTQGNATVYTYAAANGTADGLTIGTFEHSGTKVSTIRSIGNTEYDVAPFTADTKYVSLSAEHLYADAAVMSNAAGELGWFITPSNDYSVYRNRMLSQTGTKENPIKHPSDISGPYQVFVPTFSGEYKVYGLKYGHVEQAKSAKVDINGNHYNFNDTGNKTKANDLSGWCTFWSNPSVVANGSSSTITLTAGVPVTIMINTYNGGDFEQGGVAALAFVPVNQVADVTIDDSTRKSTDLRTKALLEEFMAEDFTSENVQTYNIKLKDSTVAPATEAVDFAVRPLFRRSQFPGSERWKYNEKSIVGHPTRYATVEDFIDKYLVDQGNAFADIKTDSQTETYQVYVNGIREYRTDVKLLMPGDEVEIKKEAVTSANFKPFDIGANEAFNTFYNLNGGYVRFGLKASVINKNTYPHLYNGLDVVSGTSVEDIKGTYPTDTFFAGSMTIVKEGDYQGQKIYFPLVGMSDNIDISGDAGRFLPNIRSIYSGHDTAANKGIKTITVETPEGEKTVADPYVVTTGEVGSWYNATGLFWVNSTTTNDVRFEKIDDEYVIRTDGFALIRVITKKADGSTETARAELTPGKSYSFKPESGDTVYVWKDTPYGGYSVIPLFAPFVGE